MITHRPAFSDERARASSLCEPSSALPGDGETQCFLAVKSRPVERIVGAAFWRETPTSGTTFEWAMLAAMQGSTAETEFLNALADHTASLELRTTVWIEPHSPAAQILATAGFREIAMREIFTAKVSAWRKRLETFPAHDFQTAPLTPEHAADVQRLLTGCGYSESELNQGFATATGENPSLFDFPSSAILIRAGSMIGVCLALSNPHHTHLAIASLAIAAEQTAIEAGVAALIRHTLAASSPKEIKDFTL